MAQAQALTQAQAPQAHWHRHWHTGTSTDTLAQARVTMASRALKPIYQHQEHHHHLEMSVDGFQEAALDLQVTMGPLPGRVWHPSLQDILHLVDFMSPL